ncbi:MAG: acyl-CoA reductase [Halothiobacillaceae bacterium]
MSTTDTQTGRHFWFGEWLALEAIEARLEALPGHIEQTAARPFPFEDLLVAADRLADDLSGGKPLRERLAALARETNAGDDVAQMLEGMVAMLRAEALQGKLRAELGVSRPGELTRIYPQRQFEAWYPVGCVVHVMPANVFAVAALGLIEGLLVGNVNVVKLSARDSAFAAEFAEALCARDPGGRLCEYIAVVHVASSDTGAMQRLFAQADAISAWGGERAIAAVRAQAPEGARLVAWGHKVSFGYVAAECLADPKARHAALEGAARDTCRLDQQACSSPQTLFVEGGRAEAEAFAADLAERLRVISPSIPGQEPDDAEQAELTTVVSIARAEEALGLTRVFEDAEHGRWRVILDERPGLKPSPLFRTLWVKPIQREQIVPVLRPMRAWLQTCGLSCGLSSLAPLSRALFAAGITRIARPGEMVDSYLGAPHDGVHALAQLARRISVDAPEAACGVGSFAELEGRMVPPPQAEIMDKPTFQARATAVHDADLVFQSGGSSGTPVFSTFSWDDYHDQMRAAGHGLVAAGLEPDRDRVMNLYASGHLYGSFVSFWTILEQLRVRQVPMAMVHDYDEIAERILLTDTNVLVGMPSHLLPLMETQRDRLAGRIEKIFYAGERLTRSQYRFLTETCQVRTLRSAVYGSNDAGPMGYQCPHCTGSVHHVLTGLQTLEIVRMEDDEPVQGEEVGRLLLTSHARRRPIVARYEIGDTGRWVPGACPCGRRDPRFELLGRIGDTFKAGGPFFNYRRFVNLLDEQLGYAGPVQIHIQEQDRNVLLVLWIDESGNVDPGQVEQMIRAHYAEIDYCEKEFGLAFRFAVRAMPANAFERIAASGKIRPVCDHRLETSQ